MVCYQREFTVLRSRRRGNEYLLTGFFEGESNKIQTVHIPASLINRLVMKLEMTIEGDGITGLEIVSINSFTKKEKRQKGRKSPAGVAL